MYTYIIKWKDFSRYNSLLTRDEEQGNNSKIWLDSTIFILFSWVEIKFSFLKLEIYKPYSSTLGRYKFFLLSPSIDIYISSQKKKNVKNRLRQIGLTNYCTTKLGILFRLHIEWKFADVKEGEMGKQNLPKILSCDYKFTHFE